MAKTRKRPTKKAKPARAAKKAAPKKAKTKKAAPNKAKAKSAPNKANAKSAPKKASPKQAVPKQAAPKQAVPKKAKVKGAPKQAAPKQAVPKQAAPKQAPQASEPHVPAPSAVDNAWASPDASTGTDRFRSVADALVADLEAAAGDDAKETAALQKAIDGYLVISGGGDPVELGLAEYFADDGTATRPPALERVANASDADIFRWREKLADLAGY